MTKRNDKRKVLEIGNKFQVKEEENKHKKSLIQKDRQAP